jgi:hypothetical protein
LHSNSLPFWFCYPDFEPSCHNIKPWTLYMAHSWKLKLYIYWVNMIII